MSGQGEVNETQLRALVDIFSERLPENNTADARELIAHGEYGEALELLCTQVYEYEVPVTSETYKIIEACGKRMQMEESSWTLLRELLAP